METVTTNVVRNFSDLDLNFTIHPVKKDLNRHVGEMAIVNSIKNLVLTNHYERPFRPSIGSNVRRLLFENMDGLTATSLENEIRQVITNFEPRARVVNVSASPMYEENGYNIRLIFFVINKTDPVTITFFLERIR